MIASIKHVDAFLSRMVHTAQAIGRKWKIPPSVIIAQAALETGWGQAVKGNAYFGIKQGASADEAVAFTTHEVIDGQVVSLVDRFRKYRSLQNAANAYGQFLHDTPRYQEALQDTSAPAMFMEAFQQAGYATDPRYAEKLQQIIQRYQLTAYDHVQHTTRLHDAPERNARSGGQGGSRWSAGVSKVLKYLTVPQSRPNLQLLNLGADRIDARHQRSVSGDGLDPAPPLRNADSPVHAAPPRLGHAFADFPSFLWEHIQQFTWSHGWHRPQPSTPTPEGRRGR
jgi:hypothetical protein